MVSGIAPGSTFVVTGSGAGLAFASVTSVGSKVCTGGGAAGGAGAGGTTGAAGGGASSAGGAVAGGGTAGGSPVPVCAIARPTPQMRIRTKPPETLAAPISAS